MKPLKVICVDDSDKPDEIPDALWVKQDEIYTIDEVAELPLQGNKLGYTFKELELDDSCFPYEYYDADRFMFLLDISAEVIFGKDNEDEEGDASATANFENLN